MFVVETKEDVFDNVVSVELRGDEAEIEWFPKYGLNPTDESEWYERHCDAVKISDIEKIYIR